MNALIDRAGQCTKNAKINVELKRPDRAYVEWLMSSDIILHIIPLHRNYPELNRQRGDLHQKYRHLIKVRPFT